MPVHVVMLGVWLNFASVEHTSLAEQKRAGVVTVVICMEGMGEPGRQASHGETAGDPLTKVDKSDQNQGAEGQSTRSFFLYIPEKIHGKSRKPYRKPEFVLVEK